MLKSHPDKIRDQESYILLSDDNPYDQEIRLAALQKEAAITLIRKETTQNATNDDYSPPRGASCRKDRDGHIYEERAPVDVALSDEDSFTDKSPSYSRKHNSVPLPRIVSMSDSKDSTKVKKRR
jgi:hypothetical protein